MPYTDGKHSLAKLQVSISKLQVSISEIKQYFHHDIWAAASCCGLQLQSCGQTGGRAPRRGCASRRQRRASCGTGEGAALAAQPAWEKHTEEQASIMAWCAAWCPAVLAQSHGEQRQPQELQDLRKRRQEQGQQTLRECVQG